MAKIDITKTELVWPGKYNQDDTRKEVSQVSLPFHVIETVDEGRATREAKKGGTQATLFDVWGGKEGAAVVDGWKNKLIWEDNPPNRKIASHPLQIGWASATIPAS